MRRLFAALLIVWFAGFAWFTIALPQPLERATNDAAIVPTGAAGRIARGVDLLESGAVEALLVTGVANEVSMADFAREFDVPDRLMECCVTLGYGAQDTRGNAAETAAWVANRRVASVRLVTTDWHMRRARNELSQALPPDVAISSDAVASEPSFRILFVEYHKLLASWVVGLLPV